MRPIDVPLPPACLLRVWAIWAGMHSEARSGMPSETWSSRLLVLHEERLIHNLTTMAAIAASIGSS